MKPFRLLLPLALLALPAVAAAQGFEGVLKQRTITVYGQGISSVAGAAAYDSDPAKVLAAALPRVDSIDPALARTDEMTVTVKGRKMRVDGQGMYSIVDAATGTTYTINPGMKLVMVATLADMAEMQKLMAARSGAPDSAALAAPPAIADLGQGTVHGSRAHGYRVTSPVYAAEVWVDPSLTGIMAVFEDMQKALNSMTADAAYQAAVRDKGFPLRATLVSKTPAMLGQGWMLSRTDFTSVEKQPVADALFVIPADYKQTSMKDMMPH